MIYAEKKMNLFAVEDKYYLAHCISSDYALGAGIAVEFQKNYHLRDTLKRCGSGKYPECILIGKVFNLVTKQKYYNKPTEDSLKKALLLMKDQILATNVKYLAMPKIGCGLDRLQWGSVSEIIKDIFNDVEIEILICFK